MLSRSLKTGGFQVARNTTHAGLGAEWLTQAVVAHRANLESRAFRIVGNQEDATDVVQEAFLKCMLAAPELKDAEHALAYLRTTVTNLSLNVVRTSGRRPSLVALGPEDTFDREDLFVDPSPEMSESLIEAENAAMVRQALSRLTPAQRQALLLMDGMGASTEEVAEELGLTTNATRQLLLRARRSLRHTLENWIVDEERGISAADMLSVAASKAAKAAKDAGKVAMALLLVVSGIGFFLNGRDSQEIPVADEKPAQVSPSQETTPTVVESETPEAKQSDEPQVASTDAQIESAMARLQRSRSVLQQYSAVVTWPGADANGVPSGAWVSNGSSAGEALVVNSNTTYGIDGSIYTTSDLITGSLLLNQSIKYRLNDLQYHVSPSVQVNGEWIDLDVVDTDVQVTKFGNIQVLVTAWIVIDTTKANELNLPSVIGVRIHTTEVGQPIFGQSVVLITPSGDQ